MAALSYLLVFLEDDGPGRYRPGMVVDVRDIKIPIGRMETLPKYGIIYTDRPPEDLQHLVEEDAIDLSVTPNEERIFYGKRKLVIDNPGLITVLKNKGAFNLPAASILKTKQASREA